MRLNSGLLVNLPVKVMVNQFATGVDDVSCTAKSTDPGYQADTWIMAPSGTVPGTTNPCANRRGQSAGDGVSESAVSGVLAW